PASSNRTTKLAASSTGFACLRFHRATATLTVVPVTARPRGTRMIRTLCASLLVLAVATTGSAQTTLKTARERWLRGNYDEARAKSEELLKDAKQKSAAAIGISRIHQSRGDYDKALAILDTALADDARNADVLARKAEVLYLRGRWDEAQKAADAAIASNKD